MAPTVLLSILLGAFLSKVIGYTQFMDKLPNGNIVPNPYNRWSIWPGVGHQNSQGGGPRNPFGLDFKANYLVWNRNLCEKDSDGDGLTNGQELGDPNCIWTEGSIPTFSTNLSHPGICEPVQSSKCFSRNSWLTNSNALMVDCPSISQSGVNNYLMRFPETPVPAANWTVICRGFGLPPDVSSTWEADIIAIEPIIVNAAILRYMVLYGCTYKRPDEPYLCDIGGDLLCSSFIGLWSVGSAGQCLNSQLGFRLGLGGFKYGVVQLYWNNPQLKANLVDSSGFKIYYTTTARPYQGQTALIGQTYLAIPPGQEEFSVTGSCNSVCTKELPVSVYITSAVLHMNLLGKRGRITHKRNGTVLRTLVDIPMYTNMLNITEFADPIEIKPGDEVQVSCVYRSTERKSTTHYGNTLMDEMCYGLFVYYPAIEGVSNCGQWKSVDHCTYNDVWRSESCDLYRFLTKSSYLTTFCGESCSTKDCTTLWDQLNATGCLQNADVISLGSVFFPGYYEVFVRCLPSIMASLATVGIASMAHVVLIMCGMHYLASIAL